MAFTALLVIRIEGLGAFLLSVPESLLMIAAGILLVGGYRGPRLIEWHQGEDALQMLDLDASTTEQPGPPNAKMPGDGNPAT